MEPVQHLGRTQGNLNQSYSCLGDAMPYEEATTVWVTPERNKFFEDVPTPDPELQELLCQKEPRSYITEAGEILQAKPGQVISCDDPKKVRLLLPEGKEERKKIPV